MADINFSGDDNVYLENRSVRENIMFGQIKATEEEYNRARDTALVDEEKYLSQSMKQRVTLARRLISNPEYIDIKKELSNCDVITIKMIIKNIRINYPEINIL
jgi:ABC-type multidrug transport system fused ATPase/permease subunit